MWIVSCELGVGCWVLGVGCGLVDWLIELIELIEFSPNQPSQLNQPFNLIHLSPLSLELSALSYLIYSFNP